MFKFKWMSEYFVTNNSDHFTISPDPTEEGVRWNSVY